MDNLRIQNVWPEFSVQKVIYTVRRTVNDNISMEGWEISAVTIAKFNRYRVVEDNAY